jgi:hypothetical protein
MGRVRFVALGVALACGACGGDDSINAIDPPPCGDPVAGGWDPRFAFPGVSGPYASVETLVRLPDGRIAVGGSFDHAVDGVMHNVAAWDGAVWSSIGEGLPGPVRGLALDDAGTLWAVGTLDPDGRDDDYVASWDGLAWTFVAEGEHDLWGLTVIADGIAVHGSFDTIAGVEAHGLAVWNGAAWSARGLDPGSAGYTVTRTPDGFCVGGRLVVASDGIAHDGAACREGSTWTALGSSPHVLPTVLAQAPDGRWWAGGYMTFLSAEQPETVIARGIAYLADDDTWTPLDGGVHDWDGFFPSPSVDAILFEDDAVLVAGRFVAVGPDRIRAAGLARWSVTGGWAAVAGTGQFPVDGEVNAVLADGARLHLGGSFAGIDTTLALHVATIEDDETVTPWTGERSALGPAAWVRDIVESPGGIVVAGSISAGGLVGASAALFDGGWQSLPGQPRFQDTVAAAILDDGSPVLSGELVRRWDGAAWTPIVDDQTGRSPLLVDADGALYFIVPVVGGREVMRWRDGALTSFGVIAAGGIAALTIFDGTLVALVEQSEGQIPERMMIRRDTTWEVIDGAPTGQLASMTVSKELGLVVTSYTDGVDAWDGTTWRTLLAEPATAVAACDGGLFAARSRVVDGRVMSSPMFYDGAWSSLGEEEHIQFSVLAPTSDGLYVGVFATGEPGIRRWTSLAR